MGQEYPFLWCQSCFCLACLSHPGIKLLSQTVHHCYVSRLMTKPTKWHVRPAKTQISLDIRPVWSESSLSAWGKLGSLASIPNSKFIHFSGYTIIYNYMRCNTISNILVATHWTHSEDSDQTERMPRLIWVLVGRTVILFVLSWGGSYIDDLELLLQHMFLGCNCIDKHFVEEKKKKKKKQFVEIFRTFTVFFFFFFFFFVVKTTAQAFEQNQCHDIIRSSEMNMLFGK